MNNDRVSGMLSEEDRTEILSLIDQAKDRMPYLVDLNGDERRTLLRMGDKSEAFVRRAQDVANRNQEILPRAFDLEEMNADIKLYFELQRIQWAVAQLKELMDDTVSAVGAEALGAGLEVYRYAKYADTEGLDGLRALMGQRFSRGPAPAAGAASEATDAA